MLGGNENKKDKKEELAYDDVMKVIDEWCEVLEVRLIDDDLQSVKNEIWKAVQKERLTFNSSDEIFTYVLKKPIKKKDDSGNISILKIHEAELGAKKDISKKKSDTDAQAALYHTYCKDDKMEEIPIGFLTRIKDRDQLVINAVILGFFVQIVPGVKSAG